MISAKSNVNVDRNSNLQRRTKSNSTIDGTFGVYVPRVVRHRRQKSERFFFYGIDDFLQISEDGK